MKLIKIESQPGGCPPNHHDLTGQIIIDMSSGSKVIQAALICMETAGRADPHVHEDAEHLFIMLKGEMGIKTPHEEVRLKPGDAAYIPDGEVHSNYNLSDGETEYVAVTCRIKPELFSS